MGREPAFAELQQNVCLAQHIGHCPPAMGYALSARSGLIQKS